MCVSVYMHSIYHLVSTELSSISITVPPRERECVCVAVCELDTDTFGLIVKSHPVPYPGKCSSMSFRQQKPEK